MSTDWHNNYFTDGCSFHPAVLADWWAYARERMHWYWHDVKAHPWLFGVIVALRIVSTLLAMWALTRYGVLHQKPYVGMLTVRDVWPLLWAAPWVWALAALAWGVRFKRITWHLRD